LLAVLCILAGFSIVTQSDVDQRSVGADQANQRSTLYQDARFWVGQEESLERKYRLEPGPEVMAAHKQAEQRLTADLKRLEAVTASAKDEQVIDNLLALHARYVAASARMLEAVDANDPKRVIYLDHNIVDPVFGQMETIVYDNASKASRVALEHSSALRHEERGTTNLTVIGFAVGLGLLLVFGSILARFRRRVDALQVNEVKRLAEMAITDPLTGLRNHRAFHEDLARSLHRVGRSGVPVSLVMIDLDGLKQTNDTLGHQAGDLRLRALADAVRATLRGADAGYRVGGDEFAVILDNTKAWSALDFAHRLHDALASHATSHGATASAGIAEATEFIDKDTLIRHADLALMGSKRSGQGVAIYATDMHPGVPGTARVDHDHFDQTLANALARAVDAKDSYTRSHSQTVAHLCALIAGELALEPERIARIRLAGLLHDVGKIGVPDAILNKPGKLSEDEYERMRAHSVLGYEIVSAAELATEAEWVRHHHERYDGNGYPDRIAGDAIPLESRIIFVADAFEAMTADRPYRRAPGREFALEELRRNAGTQFDPAVVAALIRVVDGPPRGSGDLIDSGAWAQDAPAPVELATPGSTSSSS
jgi:diguanylate cyclase (GGDEF)-like protein